MNNERVNDSKRLRAAARSIAHRLGVPSPESEDLIVEMIGELLCDATDAVPDYTPQTISLGNLAGASVDERRVSYLRVPFNARSEQGRPLQRVVAFIADKVGISDFVAATTLTYALEAIADEVGAGNVVRVPGFGIWGPWRRETDDGMAIVYPRFVAARPFRQYTRMACRPESAKNDELSRFQRSHHPSSRPKDRRLAQTWKTMRVWRDDLQRQMEGD